MTGTAYGRLVALTRSEAMDVAERAAGPDYELGTVVEASYGWVFLLEPVAVMSGGKDHVGVEADTGRVFYGGRGAGVGGLGVRRCISKCSPRSV